MSLRVTVTSEVKAWERRSRRETESEEGGVSASSREFVVVDPKPGDLITVRQKLR